MMLVRRILSTLLAAAALAGCGFAGTPQPLFTARGVVTDAAGEPVPGAVVSDGRVGVLTDEDGRYAIGLFETRLQVLKPGFGPASLEADRETTGRVRLGSTGAASPRVAIDTRWVGARMDAFRDHLAEVGTPVLPYPATPLARIDVLMLVTPGAFRAEELTAVRSWLRAGGRLILCAEWGGYPAQDLDLLNALAGDAGITFTGATVKLTDADPAGQEWLSIEGVSPPSLGRLTGEEPLHLYTSTSLALAAPAQPVFSTDRRSYSVLAARTGPQVVAAVGAAALGKVFALGDSSLWLDEDSDGAGAPNWRRGANFRLAEAFMRW